MRRDPRVADGDAQRLPGIADKENRSRRSLVRCLGNRWAIPILNALSEGPMRSGKLKRSLAPVSQRMMTLSLRRLEQDGLVFRQELPSQPPQVTYGLTPLGQLLQQRLSEIEAWLAGIGPDEQPCEHLPSGAAQSDSAIPDPGAAPM